MPEYTVPSLLICVCMQFPVLIEMSVSWNLMLALDLEGLKCVLTTRGVPSVVIHGTMLMLQLLVCSQDTHLMVCVDVDE